MKEKLLELATKYPYQTAFYSFAFMFFLGSLFKNGITTTFIITGIIGMIVVAVVKTWRDL